MHAGIELRMPFMLSSSETQVLCTIGGSKPSASGTLLFLCQSVNAVQLCGSSMHHSWMSDWWCCQCHNTYTLSPVGQAPPSSSIPIPLPCPSNGMLPSNPTMSSLPTPCPIESPALSPSQRCHSPVNTYNPSGILLYQINSVMTDFLGVKLHGGLPWLIFDVGSGQAVVGSNSTRTFNDGQWHTGYVALFEQASNTFYVTMDTVHAAAITAAIVPLLTMKHMSYPLLNAPDGFDAVSVQNVGSTYIIVSWDLPTDSNGILINFSLYCNGALAGVLPLTVISYNTTGLLPFTLYMYMSSSHARRHCTLVGTRCWASSVLQPACPDAPVHCDSNLLSMRRTALLGDPMILSWTLMTLSSPYLLIRSLTLTSPLAPRTPCASFSYNSPLC
ncbi:hypothetical protein EMCRGX_G026633 [Ephydatia muelleri]